MPSGCPFCLPLVGKLYLENRPSLCSSQQALLNEHHECYGAAKDQEYYRIYGFTRLLYGPKSPLNVLYSRHLGLLYIGEWPAAVLIGLAEEIVSYWS